MGVLRGQFPEARIRRVESDPVSYRLCSAILDQRPSQLNIEYVPKEIHSRSSRSAIMSIRSAEILFMKAISLARTGEMEDRYDSYGDLKTEGQHGGVSTTSRVWTHGCIPAKKSYVVDNALLRIWCESAQIRTNLDYVTRDFVLRMRSSAACLGV